jgi:hypothetical protein
MTCSCGVQIHNHNGQAHVCDASFTRDPRRAIQFTTKKAAVQAAQAIGWLAKDAQPIEVMGFALYTIGVDHCRFLTPVAFESLQRATK